MAFPILPFGIAMLGTYLGGGSVKQPDLIDPRGYGNELLYSNADISSDISMLGNRFGRASSKAIGDIKQVGAAGRLPEGAIMSNIKGTQAEAAEGISSMIPGLRREGRQSYMDYINMVNKTAETKTMYEQAGIDRTLGGLGQLGKIALLWQSGLLNPNRLKTPYEQMMMLG